MNNMVGFAELYTNHLTSKRDYKKIQIFSFENKEQNNVNLKFAPFLL